jgi:hypothetical protein
MPLEVVGPGGSLSTFLLPRLIGETPVGEATATAADSCARTKAVLVFCFF